MHPTGGTLRVFKQFVQFEADSIKAMLSGPAHWQVTLTVRYRWVAAFCKPNNDQELTCIKDDSVQFSLSLSYFL